MPTFFKLREAFILLWWAEIKNGMLANAITLLAKANSMRLLSQISI